MVLELATMVEDTDTERVIVGVTRLPESVSEGIKSYNAEEEPVETTSPNPEFVWIILSQPEGRPVGTRSSIVLEIYSPISHCQQSTGRSHTVVELFHVELETEYETGILLTEREEGDLVETTGTLQILVLEETDLE